MSNLINMELVEALNPLYAFPIVAVILCAFIVYTFGFKSPVQPPSFDDIEEEKKFSKKRKTKETSKNKVVQNGKLNGTASNKAQAVHSTKKKDVERTVPVEKPVVEKSVSSEKTVNEKKSNKKSKQTTEKKAVQESKKESFSPEDAGDGWVQLVSKKGRKNRKKDEVEAHPPVDQQIKSSQIKKSDEIVPSEEAPKSALEDSAPEKVIEENPLPQRKAVQTSPSPERKEAENSPEKKKNESTLPEKKNTSSSSKKKVSENPVPDKKVALKEDKNNANVNVENNKDKIIIEDSKVEVSAIEKVVSKENTISSGKLSGEASNKSKKKKKKNAEVISSNNNNINNNNILNRDESPVEQVISELPAPQNANNKSINANINNTINTSISTPVISETTPVVIQDKVEDTQQKESKSSNVVFDELAELLPEKKEQRKKKKVRKDH